jgi:MFS transporter, OCT family, solute carrier family 22 (organic cation transporter), member 4/5
VGGALGIPIGGYFSDHFGRKRTFFWFLVFYIVMGVASCYAPTYTTFVVLTCIQNLASNPVYFIPYIIGIEILVPEARSTFSVLLTVAYTMGGVVFTGLAYFVRDWRLLLFGSTAPFALFIAYWYIMPEVRVFSHFNFMQRVGLVIWKNVGKNQEILKKKFEFFSEFF